MSCMQVYIKLCNFGFIIPVFTMSEHFYPVIFAFVLLK